MKRGPWKRGLGIAFAVWAAFGLACAASAWWGVRTHGHSEFKIVAYEVLVWLAWAVWTPLVAFLGRRLPLLPINLPATVVHVALALVLGLVHHVWWTALSVWIKPFDAMGRQDLSGVADGIRDKLFLEGLVYFAVLGVTYAVDYRDRLRERELRAAQLEASLTQARLSALELQLQPHFLFNTLHAIGGLVRQQRGPEAIEMIAGLSDLLRYSLDQAGKHLVPLEQELAIIERYLEIQRLRFSDRLAIDVDVTPETRRALVPALMLQPLVENAVRHGIERSSGAGTITVSARRDGDDLTLTIANPGTRIVDAPEGIGVANTRARLAQLFGDRQSFGLRAENGRVTAAVTLPFAEAAA
jgi:two-component system LytT family sensor kinase